jgi:hypothetical protein
MREQIWHSKNANRYGLCQTAFFFFPAEQLKKNILASALSYL